MATLVKEKRREKKKPKEKPISKNEVDLPSLVNDLSLQGTQSTSKHITNVVPRISRSTVESRENEEVTVNTKKSTVYEEIKSSQSRSTEDLDPTMKAIAIRNSENIHAKDTNTDDNQIASFGMNSVKSNSKDNLNNLKQSSEDIESNTNCLSSVENTQKNLKEFKQNISSFETLEQSMVPSAPELEEVPPVLSHPVEQRTIAKVKPKIQCMPLAEAIRVYGGKEIAEVKAMSEREEALVEAGPVSGYEHPLVDLLSTFRLSLIAVERERAKITSNIVEEEKARSQLWKIKKRTVYVSEKCRCGTNVDFKAVFDHAELLKEKLPAARMRLEALTRDVQDSYCHHQHAALLAHCQIEDFVSETVQSGKNEIREALFLILQALRLSDGAVEAYAHALQRWASALSAALVDDRDLRQLLFLFHHLFRQTRSVRWAARIVRVNVTDAYSAARAMAVLDLLLARPGLENAVECTEELEAWEEVDVRGGAGAVGEGRLRERDLLALLRAMPLHSLFARLALFPRSDIRSGSPLEWGDASGGHGILKSCCGVRALLDVFQRAMLAHSTYTRLHERLRVLASKLLHSLAALHLHSSPVYLQDLKLKIQAELEACFAAGFNLIGDKLDRLPASLLSESSARHYCITFIMGLHDKTPFRIEALSVEAPVLPCEVRVGVVSQAALDRTTDHELARTVLEFLFQTAIKRKSQAGTCACSGSCETAARGRFPSLFSSHRYLHTTAFAVLADFHQTEPVEASFITYLCPEEWRPNPLEMRSVLDDWAQRCPLLIQHLLLHLNYTPHVGLSLETQLTIGSWLCGLISQSTSEPEWCWAVLSKLFVHRTEWSLPLDAPPPEDPKDLFSTAYALMSSSWGHCIPLACGPGAEALVRVCGARPHAGLRAAVSLLRLMAASPESLSYTPKFTEAFTILLNVGPSLMQRALGRGGLSGAEKLQRLVLDQLAQNRYSESASSLLSAWLHALWKLSLPVSSRGILDAAVRSVLQWTTLDAHVTWLLQEENSKEYIADAIRNAHIAPLLCEAILRNAHANEVRSLLHARLLDALWGQHRASQRIHVDNALKQINPNITADELVIHRTAAAVLTAPFNHPAHLTLWRLFFHIYLQRPPSSPQETTAPIGPLFFSGLVKSRVLTQLKKRLQDTVTYHQKQTELLKASPKNDTPPERPARLNKTSPTVDTSIFPSISIQDLSGENLSDSVSDAEDDDVISTTEGVPVTEGEANSQDSFNLICYHSAAEKLVRVYSRWLEDGENVRATPHHADTARFIPEQALDAAWRSSIPSYTSTPDSPSSPAFVTGQSFECLNATQSHYERAVQTVLSVKDTSHRRPRKISISSPLQSVNFNDSRSLLAFVDKLLAELREFAQEWSSEVRYISKLDSQLWELVGVLRVKRPLPPVANSCSGGCKPITVRIPEDEWCLSTGAEQGINENRRSARTSLRRLARARPAAARTAAALHGVAIRVRNAEGAMRIVERASRFADFVEGCGISKQALTALVTNLAERWICQDGERCAALVRAWGGGGGGMQALCAAAVRPRALPPAAWPALYCALLSASLPPHAAFSYLSKFEMSRWSENAESSQRKEVLDALVVAAQSLAPISSDQHQVLLELLGVHATAVVTRVEVCAFTCACARASASRRLPPAFCAAAARAVDAHAAHVPFDELGHVQRELGVIWWEARTSNNVTTPTTYAEYAEHSASVLSSLQRAFVAAANGSSYEPAMVAWYAWSSLRESWGPWVTPHSSPPLLPSTGEQEAYTLMLARFVETLKQVMDQCPGSEESLLRQVWEWTLNTFLSLHHPRTTQESRVQLSALLVELASLPWHHQWYHLDCLKTTLQAVSTGDKEMNTWLGRTWRAITASSWLRGATEETIAPALAALLALFLSPHAHHSPQTLLEACNLPWIRLPEAALEEALERFFIDHYNVYVPYHDAPQFIVLLSACELRVPGSAGACSSQSRGKRACGVTRWTLAAAAPALNAHVRAHCASLLAVLSALAPYIENSAGELEELLSRAMAIMYMEAASTALPVWEQWVSNCAPRLRLGCASAVGMLTPIEYFAALADAVARAQLADKEGSGWSDLVVRWSACSWADCSSLAARGNLHAAYAILLAKPHTAYQIRATFNALTSLSINFIENEAIIGVWICVACRYGRDANCTGDEEMRECIESGVALLTRWGAEQRRSLLQVMALQSSTGCPTPQHRLLCKLSQCIISPSESAIQSYEAACASVLGTTAGDSASWGRNPTPKRLPRLAMRLYPKFEIYFREELQLAPDSM